MILLAYDGSADAQAAIDHVAQLLPGASATVITVWEPLFDALIRGGSSMGLGTVGGFEDCEKVDAVNRADALKTATEGAARATAAGLVADGAEEVRQGDLAHSILHAAIKADADLIVAGTRGQSGIRSFVMGSTSDALVQHADRPVLVVPSPELSERRRRQIDHQQALAGQNS